MTDTVETLDGEIQHLYGVIQSLESTLRDARAALREKEKQRDALALEAIGLKPGDYLMITPEFHAFDLPHNGNRTPKAGTIAGVRSASDTGIYAEWIPNGFGVWTPEARAVTIGHVPLEYVSAMRQAWLQWEKERENG